MALPIYLTVIAIFTLCCVINCNNGVEAFHYIYADLQSISAPSVSKLHRTGYHFQPHSFTVLSSGSDINHRHMQIQMVQLYAIPENKSVVRSSIKHVLKNSLDFTRYEYYTVGTYFKNKGKYIPDNNTSEDGWGGLRYDYGNFYAFKSFFDPSKNRRILWAWANESNFQENDVKKGWAGIQVVSSCWWSTTSRPHIVVKLHPIKGDHPSATWWQFSKSSS
ncbi:hypothetical protein JHK86_004875 [Glycine max]|nr:hypothetical protein JHK86_004875 [Glycine max]